MDRSRGITSRHCLDSGVWCGGKEDDQKGPQITRSVGQRTDRIVCKLLLQYEATRSGLLQTACLRTIAPALLSLEVQVWSRAWQAWRLPAEQKRTWSTFRVSWLCLEGWKGLLFNLKLTVRSAEKVEMQDCQPGGREGF